MRHRQPGDDPPNEKAPELATLEGPCNTADDLATTAVYHTQPSTPYPLHKLTRTRRGDWRLTRIELGGRRTSRFLPTRQEALELLDVLGSLTRGII